MVLNTFFNLISFPLPKPTAIYLCVAEVMAEVKNDIRGRIPPTTLYSPKSETPNDCSNSLVVKNERNIATNCLT